MASLPGLRPDRGTAFAVGDVVSLDRVAYARIAKGPGALAEMAARKLPRIVGQVSQADRSTVEVIWEDGRLGVFAYPDRAAVIQWTSTEVLILE